IINEGTLAYSALGNLGSGNAIVFGGGTLQTTASVSESRNVTLNAGGGTIDTNGLSSTFSGVFSGSGGLTKIGTGTLTVSNTNSYTGDTTVDSGVLEYTTNGNLGSTSNSININAATLRTLAAGTQARAVSLNASTSTIDTGAFNSTFSGLFSGAGGI